MNFVVFLTFFFVILFGRLTVKSQLVTLTSPTEPKKRLIIDTDAGSDDGVAILNFLAAEELYSNVKVELITTVNGNTNVDNVVINVLKVLKTMDRLDIPVYKGANYSILTTPKIENFFGEDGFGDFIFENPPSVDLIQKKHAVLALIEAAASNPGQLTLVCQAPLTNIALALRLDKQFFKNLKEIYILGGSDSGVGNIVPGVEFNTYMDPEATFIAYDEAIKSNKILNVIPWETALYRSKIEMNWRKNVLGAIDSPQVQLINNAERLSLTGENWISADTILSSIVIDNKLIKNSETYYAEVEVCGRYSRGVIIVDYGSLKNKTSNIHLIKKIYKQNYKDMLLQTFSYKKEATNSKKVT